jgi:uncharacterized membrane protein YsdA (DUF1294 family)
MLTGLSIWMLIASLVTGILYTWDKRAAIKDFRRVPEKTLLGLSLLGGWPGGWIAGQILRHKTLKRSYRIRFLICVAVNVAMLMGLLWVTRSRA